MTIHKEGAGLLFSMAAVLVAINTSVFAFAVGMVFPWVVLVLSSILYLLVLNFFRYQARKTPLADVPGSVMAPADGRVVVIEEVEETEHLHCRCKQISIFMSVFNIHVNWIPCNGVVEHSSHQNGKFMAAYLPKSSTDNERSTVIIRTPEGHRILVRQIAGAVAQRIVTYPQAGDVAQINDNLGFIKFGSRVDVFLPLDSEVMVTLKQNVQGNITQIARLPL